MTSPDRQRAVLRAAQLYFLDGLTQAAVAERLGCTRWTVGRLLKEGMKSGIVNISISHLYAREHALEIALNEKYGLNNSLVVRTQPSARETLALVAQTAADYLSDIRPRPRTVAVAWGRTTAAMARAAADNWNPGVTVVQAHTSPGEVDELLATGPARILAKKGPGNLVELGVTPIAATQREAKELRMTSRGKGALHLAQNADVIVYAPGNIPHSSLLVRGGYLTSHQLRVLWEQGARANIIFHIVDSAGEVVSEELDERTVGVSLQDLRRKNSVIAVGTGEARVDAFAAVLAGKLATTVITDSETAQALLS